MSVRASRRLRSETNGPLRAGEAIEESSGAVSAMATTQQTMKETIPSTHDVDKALEEARTNISQPDLYKQAAERFDVNWTT